MTQESLQADVEEEIQKDGYGYIVSSNIRWLFGCCCKSHGQDITASLSHNYVRFEDHCLIVRTLFILKIVSLFSQISQGLDSSHMRHGTAAVPTPTSSKFGMYPRFLKLTVCIALVERIDR